MTTLEQVSQIIMKFKKGKVTPESLKPSANLTGDLKLDSLDLTELLVLTEDTFQLKIPLEDGFKMKTLGDVVQYVDERL